VADDFIPMKKARRRKQLIWIGIFMFASEWMVSRIVVSTEVGILMSW
jgi:hypothetical protein